MKSAPAAMAPRSIEEIIRSQVNEEAAAIEEQAVAECNAALRLLKSSVTRLIDHRNLHGMQYASNPKVDYLIVDSTLKTCQTLMTV